MIGQILSHYRITKVLGQGRSSTVYAAQDMRFQREVAIRVLAATDVNSRQVFQREVDALSSVSHPSITQIFDYGKTAQGNPYIVTELVNGISVAELVRKKMLTLKSSVQIAASVAEALGELHAQGMVHRDIQPANILVGAKDRVKLIDFGDAISFKDMYLDSVTFNEYQSKSFDVRNIKLAYSAPEAMYGGGADPRSDLFAVGTTLYESVTGLRPFSGRSPQETKKRLVNFNPLPPSVINPNVPEALDAIILKALAKRPSYRYQSAEELASDLNAISEKVEDVARRLNLKKVPKSPNFYFTLEGARAKGDAVEYGVDVDLVFNYAMPPKDVLVTFEGKRLKRVLKENVDLDITVISNGFTFRDGIWSQVAKFRGGSLQTPVRFLLTASDTHVEKPGFLIMLSLYGSPLYHFPIAVRLVSSLELESLEIQSKWTLNLDLVEVINEKKWAAVS